MVLINILDRNSGRDLDVGWVEHDSNRSTEGLWWEVLLEVSTDDTRVTVGSGNLAPHNSDLGASDLLAGTVDEGDTLTEVEFSLLWRGDTLDLDQRAVRVVGSSGTLVGDVLSLNVD